MTVDGTLTVAGPWPSWHDGFMNTLARKLLIKPGNRVALVDPPDGYPEHPGAEVGQGQRAGLGLLPQGW